ncbi:uncharacterized protein I303_102114 [Kwoniella dejecticola CBS 10117]|uniref:Pentacotripeptide-repeat region of PRORP domain-containing protein n=1 Tax=Kwoniella dejecticola CBS 10117 TaxID=1296121 RepID=A0A1A6ABU5_9TREE|nr:uncharacterized protein I303_01745 [Kwoniella dejecticola CBS 10117]OBR87537.1 hypothetical protein I303_01745 [Kwoniella dejecticola CBS 10117]
METAPVSRSSLSETDVQLQNAFHTAFNLPSSSASSPIPDALGMIAITYPLIFRRQLRASLDPHLDLTSKTISSFSGALTHEQLRQAATILGHCWTRATHLKLTAETICSLESRFAEFILARATTLGAGDCVPILEILESSMKRQSGTDSLIGPHISAAWALMKIKAGSKDTPQFAIVTSATYQSIEDCLKSKANLADEELASCMHHAAQLLYHSQISRSSSIQEDIRSLRRKGDYEAVVRLWETYKAQLQASTSAKTGSHAPADPADPGRDAVLSAFLKTFKRVKSPSISSEMYLNDVIAHLPRPLPRDIAQTLLALRAGPEASATRVGEEVVSLDHEDTARSGSGDSADYLRSTWDQTEEKDLKMYMIYLDGLGRSGDLPLLKETWNALINDGKAKTIYLKEENLPLSAPFPPTQALNQMISSCLLVPDGPAVALDLFSQAVSPTSSIPINLITINTVLRHHARQADLPSMSALFTLAEKVGLKPDIITYTTLVQGLLKGGRIDLAKKVLEDMSGQGIPPNERMCSMLISDLSKIGTQKALSHSEELLNLMIKRKMKINEVTWTGLISGYFKNGWEKNGYDTIARMEKTGLKLNRIGYNILFRQFSSTSTNSAAGKDRNVITGEASQGIMKLWNKMLDDRITPNSDSYLLVLTPLVTGRRWNEATQVLEEMQKRGFRVEKGALKRIVDRVKNRR